MQKDIQKSAKRFVKESSKSKDVQSIMCVVLIGIILLVWFLTTSDEASGGGSSAGGKNDQYFFQRLGATVSEVEDNENPQSDDDLHHHHDASHDSHNNELEPPPKARAATPPPPPTPAPPPAEPKYYFELDKPRAPDEEAFFHLPKSKGGVLKKPGTNASFDSETRETAERLYEMFKKFDENEQDPKTMPAYGTMCVGRDCEHIYTMIASLHIGIGHFLVVVSTDDELWVSRFTALQDAFPGRFSKFVRPEKLSCAESWNLVVRMAFSIRPMIEQVFIANADWSARPSPGVDNQMARYCEWSKQNLHLVVNRFFHFSSFSFTKKGYLELGYFDEVIYPALAEDVEFHIKAVSKGLGTLGLYDKWNDGTKHVLRASAGERVVSERNVRVARFDYILRKWNVRVPSYRDFAHAHPYKQPWNNKHITHNNSWVVDPVHRKCANTGEGPKLDSGRCYYNAKVLQKILPSGVELDLAEAQLTKHDNFPGGYF